jgi:beta-glucosidase/6-phospho-beta-glucosidase/beta-galactosidase
MAMCPLSYLPFPDGLRWGVAISADQIEGSTAVRQ